MCRNRLAKGFSQQWKNFKKRDLQEKYTHLFFVLSWFLKETKLRDSLNLLSLFKHPFLHFISLIHRENSLLVVNGFSSFSATDEMPPDSQSPGKQEIKWWQEVQRALICPQAFPSLLSLEMPAWGCTRVELNPAFSSQTHLIWACTDSSSVMVA